MKGGVEYTLAFELSSARIQQSSNALHNKRQTAGSDWFSNITRANASN
jgi:hypothetical protein